MLETKRPVIPAGQIEEVTQIAVEAIRKCVQIADKTNFDYSATVTALKLLAISKIFSTGEIKPITLLT